MKKTKIILPAIALLAVSGIASVTGTVAWFTAASQVNATISNVAAVATTGNLSAKFAKVSDAEGAAYAGWGATGLTESQGAISATLPKLRDASYDNVNDKTYRANWGVDGAIDSYSVVTDGSSQTVGEVTSYYTASFTVNFTIAGMAEDDKYVLFFDTTSASSMTGGKTIDQAFRVSMVATNKLVWAPNNTTASVDYVNGTTKTSHGSYTETGKTLKNKTAAASRYTANNAAIDQLGALAVLDTDTPTVAVKFVFWFEGEDPACKVANLSADAASLAMSFYAIRKA